MTSCRLGAMITSLRVLGVSTASEVNDLDVVEGVNTRVVKTGLELIS